MREAMQAICPFFCHDGSGNLLFYRRSLGNTDHVGFWDSGDGSMVYGEEPLQTVVRRLKLQYGVEPLSTIHLPSLTIPMSGKDDLRVASPFLVKVNRELVKIGEPQTMEIINWYTMVTLPSPMHPGIKKVLTEYRNVFNRHTRE